MTYFVHFQNLSGYRGVYIGSSLHRLNRSKGFASRKILANSGKINENHVTKSSGCVISDTNSTNITINLNVCATMSKLHRIT